MATICILCDLHCCPYPSLFPGDVAGSVEVLESLLNKHQPHEFQFKIISSGVGNVTEADIELAHGTGGRHCELCHMKAFTVGTTVEQLHLVHLPFSMGRGLDGFCYLSSCPNVLSFAAVSCRKAHNATVNKIVLNLCRCKCLKVS